MPGREAWAEIWETIGPLLDEALAGEATWVEDFQLFLDQRLPREEAYFTSAYERSRATRQQQQQQRQRPGLRMTR